MKTSLCHYRPIEIGNFAWPLPRCWATRTTLHQRQPNDFSSYQNERETKGGLAVRSAECVAIDERCRYLSWYPNAWNIGINAENKNKSQFSCLIFLLIFHFFFSFINWEYILWLYLSSLFRFKICKYFCPFVLSRSILGLESGHWAIWNGQGPIPCLKIYYFSLFMDCGPNGSIWIYSSVLICRIYFIFNANKQEWTWTENSIALLILLPPKLSQIERKK